MTVAGTRVVPVERRLVRHDPRARGLLIGGVVLGSASSALVVFQAWLIAQVVADVFLGGRGLAEVTGRLGLVAALALVRVPLSWASDHLAQLAATRTKRALRADLTAHIQHLGPAFVGNERRGELSSVLVDGMEAVDAYLSAFQPARMMAVTVPLLVLVVILVLDPPTTLVLILTGPVLVLLLAVIGARTRVISDRRFAELRWLSAFFLDMLQGIATLKMFGRSKEQTGSIRAISRQYGDTTMEVLRTAFQTSLVLEWGSAVAVALVAVQVSLRLMSGGIDFHVALAVLIIVPEFFLPLRQLAMRYHAGSAGRSAAERVYAILDEPIRVRRAHLPGLSVGGEPIPTGADIEVRGLSFTYPGRDDRALDGLDLAIRAGRCIAVVGATGAGKSTLAAILLGFLEPDGGEILVGGVPVRDLSAGAWRRHLAWVPQRPYLFHGTIRDNLILARPEATAAEVEAATDEAGLADVLATVSGGLDAQVGEGGLRLSGGQRQRIAIARAFLSDAPFVILDEVTSHLDPTTEAAIRDAVARLSSRRTVMIISHRLRLVSIADIVVVLDHGRVVGAGPPGDLARADGPFRRLLDATADNDPDDPDSDDPDADPLVEDRA